jgi:hypothetical protein
MLVRSDYAGVDHDIFKVGLIGRLFGPGWNSAAERYSHLMMCSAICVTVSPKLTRSSLHRCLERHGISRLPENPDKASKRGKFAETITGYVHIDISQLRLAQGKLNMFLAIDRVSQFTYVEFRDDAGKMNGADFLRGVVKAFPYAIHTILTDNGMAFADLPKNRNGPTRRYLGPYIFDRVCNENVRFCGATSRFTLS